MKCVPDRIGLHWQKKLKDSGFDPVASTGGLRGLGGVVLAGNLEHDPWLGVLSSEGKLVASQAIPLGPSNSPRISALAQNARGDLALGGGIITDIPGGAEPVGFWLNSKSHERRGWSVPGLSGRVMWHSAVSWAGDSHLLVSGSLQDEERRQGAFLAKVDLQGQLGWGLDPKTWPFSRISDLATDSKGSVYVVGAVMENQDEYRQRALAAKIASDGTVVWQVYLEQAPQKDAQGLPLTYTKATQLALSLDEGEIWLAGSTGAPSQQQARAWVLGAADGKERARFDLETPAAFRRAQDPVLRGLEMGKDGIYYAWSASAYVGESFKGTYSRVARMDRQGSTNWKVDYSPSKGPHGTTNLLIYGLIRDAQSASVYVLGYRHKAPVEDGPSRGEAYGYVARFCPK